MVKVVHHAHCVRQNSIPCVNRSSFGDKFVKFFVSISFLYNVRITIMSFVSSNKCLSKFFNSALYVTGSGKRGHLAQKIKT